MNAAERAAHAVARMVGGGVDHCGSDYRVRCPVHGGEDRNLSIKNGTRGAVIVVACHSHNCSRVDILNAIREAGGIDPAVRPAPPPIRPPDRDKLRWLLSKVLPIDGSVVETYLRSRDLEVPPDGHHLRYLPPNPPKHPWPTMVGVITDVTDARRIMSLHFTRLAHDGSGKAPLPKNEQRSYLGGFTKKGGVIRLCDDADVDVRLGFAEGIETALAVYTSFRRSGWFMPVWSALDAGNLGGLSPRPGIERLAIYADRGPAGELAADTLAQRWLDAGREVFVAVAPVDDWNPAVAS